MTERWVQNMRSAVKRVPVQGRVCGSTRPTIPEGVARLAYEEYAHNYGTSQSFERLHERGGFGTDELIGLLADPIERERKGRP